MALKIDFSHNVELKSPKDLPSTYQYFQNVGDAIGKNFPGLAEFKKISENTYLWTFDSLNAGGQKVVLSFATRFEAVPPDQLVGHAVPKVGNCSVDTVWTFLEAGSGTEVKLKIKFATELPLPFFLKPIAQSLVESKVAQYFGEYANNVVKSIA